MRRPPKSSNVITSKWVFRVKYTSSNLIDRYKARLVARGFTQKYGIDYSETFAPTLKFESLQMLLAFSIYYGLTIHQMDVPNAYLKGDLQEEIFIEIPQGLKVPPGYEGFVLKLTKGLYGLKQSGREWNRKISAFLKSKGFVVFTGDNCVFINHSTQAIIALYVDNMLIFTKTINQMNEVKDFLNKEYKMKDLGPAKYILGIRIRQHENQMILDQTNYIKNFLRDYQIDEAYPLTVPIEGYEALLPSQPDEARTNQLEYQQRIGSLMYTMVATRPDIAFALGKLSQFSHDPCVCHRVALDRVLRYLRGTLNYALVYNFKSSTGDPISFADAAYGDDSDDRKSTNGHTMLIGNGAVIWSSKKQRCTVSSTTKAEYISMCQASKDIVWATRWMEELGFSKSMNMPIRLSGDNKGALDLIRNPEHHARTKHVDIQYHFVREVVEDGLAITQHVPTHEMIADIFTKPLTPAKFQKFRAMLGVREMEEE